MASRNLELLRRYPVAAFYILAFTISWLGWIPQAAYSHGLFPIQSPFFLLLGIVGPALAAVFMAYVLGGKGELRQLFAQLLRWRVGIVWYIVALSGNAAIFLVMIGLRRLLGPIALDFGKVGAWFTLFPFFLIFLLQNIWEEVGWRGFALPRLQSRYSALASSLIIGVLWGLWHLPLFLDRDNPMSTFPFIPWFIGTVASAILYTWLYNNAKSSLLVVSLFHAARGLRIHATLLGVERTGHGLKGDSVQLPIRARLLHNGDLPR